MAAYLKLPRGTRANLTTLASGNNLVPFSKYWVTDESRFAFATAVNTLVDIPRLGGTNTWAGDQTVPDQAYDATTWDGNLTVPTKNAVRDKIAITTGAKGFLQVPVTGVIQEWTLLGDVSGSAVIDIWKDTYASFPPVAGDSITASAKPTVITAQKAQSSTLTGWTTAITAGDILAFNVDSLTSFTRLTLQLKIKVS